MTSIDCSSPCGLFTFRRIAADFADHLFECADLHRSLAVDIQAILKLLQINADFYSQPSHPHSLWVWMDGWMDGWMEPFIYSKISHFKIKLYNNR